MSRASAGIVIDKLLTAVNLRIDLRSIRWRPSPRCFCGGVDLTRDAIDLWCRTDAGVWFLTSAVRGA